MTTIEKGATLRQVWPLLAVGDIDRSIAFYRDKLGFSVVARADSGGRLFWCRLERDGVSLMLQTAEEAEDGAAGERGRGVTFYFICDDADEMRTELAARGLSLGPVGVADYGMKQLFVPEPDGYVLCFESPTSTWAG